MKFQGEESARRNDASGYFRRKRTVVGSGASIASTDAVLALAARADAGRREDDLVVGGLDVLRRHLAPVVELDALAELERVGQPVLGDGPALGEITDRLGPGRVGRIDPEQRAVVRGDRVDEPEGLLAVAVVGRRLGGHREDQLPADLRLLAPRPASAVITSATIRSADRSVPASVLGRLMHHGYLLGVFVTAGRVRPGVAGRRPCELGSDSTGRPRRGCQGPTTGPVGQGLRPGCGLGLRPGCRPPGARVGPPGGPGPSAGTPRSRSGSGDGTRSPAGGWSGLGTSPPSTTRSRPRLHRRVGDRHGRQERLRVRMERRLVEGLAVGHPRRSCPGT